MEIIKELFDQKIDRRIEKVIQFNTSEQQLLEQEIREYVATEAIEENFSTVLEAIDEGMEADTEHEIGIWVSGFYGSGKSSFTKYLGFALDPKLKIEGEPFHTSLANRFTDQPLRQRLKTVAKKGEKNDLTVILLDLSTDSLAQAGVTKVSSVLYYRVLQWAGFSKEKKIAHFEFMLDQEDRWEELLEYVRNEHGKEWEEVHNNPILGNKIASKAAVHFYPSVFPSERDFSELKIDLALSEKEQVERMLDLIRRKSGSPHVLFILDEVGQYIAGDNSLILNLQGLAQNLRTVGRGKAWLIATAQQTLTDSIGAPQFFKLQARFPVTVHLEAGDIREITHRRLLSKKNEAHSLLAERYEQNGEKLNLYTKLKEARGYPTELDKERFINLYPFLPQHFDVLLNVIGQLAQTTGGTGLRSAIKVVQETLVGAGRGHSPFAEFEVGKLVTISDFFDVLRADIERSSAVRFVAPAVDTAVQHFGRESGEAAAAKGVAVMQILDDFPLTRANLASLLISSVESQDNEDAVEKAVQNLIDDRSIPLEEVEGRLRFLSDRVAELQREWESLSPTSQDKRATLQQVLQDHVFAGAPKAGLFGTKRISAQLQLFYGNYPLHISGGTKEEVQLRIRFESPDRYQDIRSEVLANSVTPTNAKLLTLLTQESEQMSDTLEDLYRSNKMILKLRGNYSDAEVGEFYKSLGDRQKNSEDRLAKLLREAMWNGLFIFRNKERAPASQGSSLDEAIRGMLKTVGEEVFDRYPHAAVQTGQGSAEKLMKTNDLSLLTRQDDPLELIDTSGSDKVIDTGHPAMEDIRSYLDTHGHEKGKDLMDHFTAAPFGWSKDTIRYLTAALFTAGVVTFRINSKDVTTRTSEAVEMIKTNPNFNKLGIFLRERSHSMEQIKRAADALTRLTGEQIMPLENKVEEAGLALAQKEYPRLLPLRDQIRRLAIAGEESADGLIATIEELNGGNGDLIISKFADPDRQLEEGINWLRRVEKSLSEGFDLILEKAQQLKSGIEILPNIDIYSSLAERTEGQRRRLEELYKSNDITAAVPEIQEIVDELEKRVGETVGEQIRAHEEVVEKAREKTHSHSIWPRLSGEMKTQLESLLETVENVGIEGEPFDIEQLKKNFNHEYERRHLLDQITRILESAAAEGEKGAGENDGSEPTILTVPTGKVQKRKALDFLEKARKRVGGLDEEAYVRFSTEAGE